MSHLDKAMTSIGKNKNISKDAFVDLDPKNSEPQDAISTGSITLDYMIGGNKLANGQRQCPGIPRGRITEITGEPGAGKTTIAIETAIKCQEEGGSVCYLDYENAIAPEYARNLGLNFDKSKFMLATPVTWEEGTEIIDAMIEAKVDLIIIDSVSAMTPQKTFEKDPSDPAQIGLLARLNSQWLPRVVNRLKKSNSALMLVNQLRSRIKTSRYDTGPDEDTSGGRSIKFYCSLRIKLAKRRTEYQEVENDLTGDTEKQPISNFVKATGYKNKVSPFQGHSTEFVIRYGEGIDNVRSIIDIADNRGIISRAGAWYTLVDENGNEVKEQGKENLRNYLLDHRETFMTLVNSVNRLSSAMPTATEAQKSKDDEDDEDED